VKLGSYPFGGTVRGCQIILNAAISYAVVLNSDSRRNTQNPQAGRSRKECRKSLKLLEFLNSGEPRDFVLRAAAISARRLLLRQTVKCSEAPH
jgi:hypothetical protein